MRSIKCVEDNKKVGNMRTLVYFELKKIIHRKVMWICMSISLLLILITVGGPLLGNYYVNGEIVGSNYEMFQIDAKYQRALDGRKIEDELLQEMQNAYSKVPLDVEQYSLTEEYQTYARPYSAIFNYVRQVMGMTGAEVITTIVNMENLHIRRLEMQEERWEDFLLSEEEKEFWRTQEAKIELPIIFRYAEGYSVLFSSVYTIGLLVIFMVSVCLAGVFPEEHKQKTDQLILSSKYGRQDIYWAKFIAGLFVALLMTLIFVFVTFFTAFILYGIDGFDAAFQLIYEGNSCPISAGQAILIAYLVVLFVGIFIGAFVMLLSEGLHSSTGTLAIIIGIMVLTMIINVPDEYRIVRQLWNYLPSNIVAGWNIFSPDIVMIFGHGLQAWQIVPMLYIGFASIAALVTKRFFVKYQISGR